MKYTKNYTYFQSWKQTFAQVWQISVFLYLIPLPGHHLNVVKGLSQMEHSFPYLSFIIRMYGLSPRHVGQRIGKSESSQFWRLYLLLPNDNVILEENSMLINILFGDNKEY